VLAAGRGSRIDAETAKPLLELHGRPLLEHALEAAFASELSPVLVVVGHDADAVVAVLPADVEVEVVRVGDWDRGISASLRAAVDAVDALDARREVSAVCIGLADQPLIGPGSYRRLAAAHAEGAELAVATYRGVRGNPVLLARTLWPAARTLTGDVGARALMTTHAVVEVDCTDTGVPTDVDTLEDLRDLEQRTKWET